MGGSITRLTLLRLGSWRCGRHFGTSCRRIVNASCEYTAGGQITVQNKGCEVKVTVSHVGIEPDLLSERLRLPQYVLLAHRVPSAAHSVLTPVPLPSVQQAVAALRARFGKRTIIAGAEPIHVRLGGCHNWESVVLTDG